VKVVILAGGLGSRLSEETDIKPKPMVEIGRHPILWHIMKHYSQYGFHEFVIPVGYRGEVIKRYFLEYSRLSGHLTLDVATGTVNVHEGEREPWVVHIIDTGLESQTGGRLKRLQPWLERDTFMLTYGDGVCDINLADLVTFHRSHKPIATLTAVRPPARFGGLTFDGDIVTAFTEKPQIGEGWINGGFMVIEPAIFNYLDGDHTSLEGDILPRLTVNHQLAAFRHEGFWHTMDTLRDVRALEALWQTGNPPWRTWE
jgi:glucose-1-phosphate cytidylyltransferase